MRSPVHLYISLATEDTWALKALEAHLSTLQRQALITVFHAGKLAPGAAIKPTIEQRLAEADLVVFVLSANYVANERCMALEMEPAMARRQAGLVKVMPIRISAVDLEGMAVARYVSYPRNRLPIAEWAAENRDAAWQEVTQALRSVVDRVLDERRAQLELED